MRVIDDFMVETKSSVRNLFTDSGAGSVKSIGCVCAKSIGSVHFLEKSLVMCNPRLREAVENLKAQLPVMGRYLYN